MYPWTARLEWRAQQLRIVLTDARGHRLMWARLPRRPVQRHGLATLLTGLALYGGCPLSAVIAADGGAAPTPDVGGCIGDPAFSARWVHLGEDPGAKGGGR